MLATKNAVVSKIADLTRYWNTITMHLEIRAKIEVICFVERSSFIEIHQEMITTIFYETKLLNLAK
jgi:hypothetical protein